MARTSRLLTLLQILRGKRLPVTAGTLAAELCVSERTLYRDIAELVAQGAPIYGEAGVGYVLRPGLFLPPLMLSEDETEAIVLGLRYVDQRGDPVLSQAAKEALAKIEAVLPPSDRETAQYPVAFPGPAMSNFPDNPVELKAYRAAIRAQGKLRIDYRDLAGKSSTRVIWPIALGFMDHVRVLAAWCELRQDFRHFRTDLIAAAQETGERYPGRRNALLKVWRVARTAAGAKVPDPPPPIE
jgi:predicted DNA-binding transcriptional regulator YafY